MRASVRNVRGLHEKVTPLGNEVLDRRDPCWAETPSIVDAERRLAVAVIARAFADLHLQDGTFYKDVFNNRRNRNAAILFLTSGPERHEWYNVRRHWATAAGYCQNKIRTKALAICKANDIHIVPVNDDVDANPRRC